MNEGTGSVRFKRYKFADRKTADNSMFALAAGFAII